MVLFGQVVVGSPGAGKTTYCRGMKMFMDELGGARHCVIVNLDFANDELRYVPAIDVRDLISLQTAMEEVGLGPNGGLVYCTEYLLKNVDWLDEQIAVLQSKHGGASYILFDCPGQVELYTHHDGMQRILAHLAQAHDARLCSVHLLDSFYCCQPSVFISAALLVITSMLRLGLPHVSLLSKVDLLKNYGPLPFNLDFFTEMLNLSPLLRYLEGPVPASYTEQAEDSTNVGDRDDDGEGEGEGPLTALEEQSKGGSALPTGGKGDTDAVVMDMGSRAQRKYRRLSAALCEVVDDFGLVSFLPLSIDDSTTVSRVLAAVDTANGYSMAANELYQLQQQHQQQQNAPPHQPSKDYLFRVAAQNTDDLFSLSRDIQEKYGSNS